MPNLLDLMPKEERDKAIARAQKRLQHRQAQKGIKISPEVYMTCEFGYYYGWTAIEAIRNNEITLEEVSVLLEGARKVWYTKLVETGGVNMVSGSYKSGVPSYETAMKPYTDRADLE